MLLDCEEFIQLVLSPVKIDLPIIWIANNFPPKTALDDTLHKQRVVSPADEDSVLLMDAILMVEFNIGVYLIWEIDLEDEL